MEKGISNVIDALRGEVFPSDKNGLYYSIGDMVVENKKGKFIPVRDILDQIEQKKFTSPEDVVNAIRNRIHAGDIFGGPVNRTLH